MIIQVTESIFIDRFKAMGRADNFSYAGLKALFEYLEQYENDTGEINISDVEHETGMSLEDLNEETTVLLFSEERIIYRAF